MNSPDLSGPPPLPQTSPLEELHYEKIRQAVLAHRAVRSAGRTAHGSGVATLTIGGLALLLTAFSRVTYDGLVVSVGVAVIGIVELLGSRRMRRADPSAARMLGLNQLAFLGLIAAYCVLQMAAFSAEQVQDAVMSPEFRNQLSALPSMQRFTDKLDKWAPLLAYGFYGLVILLSAGCQGGMAIYYFTRRKHILSFIARTPEWIRRLFRELAV